MLWVQGADGTLRFFMNIIVGHEVRNTSPLIIGRKRLSFKAALSFSIECPQGLLSFKLGGFMLCGNFLGIGES